MIDSPRSSVKLQFVTGISQFRLPERLQYELCHARNTESCPNLTMSMVQEAFKRVMSRKSLFMFGKQVIPVIFDGFHDSRHILCSGGLGKRSSVKEDIAADIETFRRKLEMILNKSLKYQRLQVMTSLRFSTAASHPTTKTSTLSTSPTKSSFCE